MVATVLQLPSTRRLWHAFVATHRYMDGGVQPSARLLSSYAASRSSSAGIAPLRLIQQQLSLSPSPWSHSALRHCGRPIGASDIAMTSHPLTYRKRPLGGRHLSSQTTGHINNGSTASPSSDCWRCDSTVTWQEHFCNKCGAVQLLDERLDYFEMFRYTPSVLLDLKGVEKRFKDMQRAFHPDLFACKSQEEQEISAANSAMANRAYQTLVQPMERVKYLMRLLGSTALEEDGGDDRSPVPTDFLMEVMETRDTLQRCSSRDEAEAILSETKIAVEECFGDMDQVLKAGGGKDELSDAAVRLRYLHRIEDEARHVMHRLEDGLAVQPSG